MIEAEVIPRLMLAHRVPGAGQRSGSDAAGRIEPADIATFTTVVLGGDLGAACRFVDALRRRGVADDATCIELLAPTARRLGEMWEEDTCNFTDVTLGLWRLQQVMYDLSPAFQNEASVGKERHRAMLVPVPGSQHSLGLFMVAEFFRRAGWEVWGEPPSSVAGLEEAVHAEWFDVIGLSVGAETQLSALPALILALRKASLNPAVGVMVGGAIFAEHPEFAIQVGADATAIDAPQAIVQAEHLVARRARRC